MAVQDQLLEVELTTPAIREFKGEFRFLSSFYDGPGASFTIPRGSVGFGLFAKTREHAFHVGKIPPDLPGAIQLAIKILNARDGREAKKMGGPNGIIPRIREDWDSVLRVPVMLAYIRIQFAPGTEMARQLMATSPSVLIEGNTWNDEFWGVLDAGRGRGKNMLGRLLMLVRAELLTAAAAGIEIDSLSRTRAE